jgi:hypothetical protein
MSKTIKDFEDRGYPKNRIKFIDLLSDDLCDASERSKIHEQLSAHPMLGPLYKARLLDFSTEYRESTLTSLKQKAQAKPQCSDSQDLAEVIDESVSAIVQDYLICTPLAQQFLNTSAQILAASKQKHDSNEIDASFEGLSIEAVPCFEGAVRSDNYQYDAQQARICFRNFNPPLNATVRQSTLLAHEFTHAIDDIYDKTQSIKILFDNLQRNAPCNPSKQEEILKCAAILVDDSTNTLQTEYLPSFIKGLYKENTNVEARMRLAKNPRPFQHESTGILECTSIPTEFLTFSIERVFDVLRDSASTKDFNLKHTEELEKRIKSARAHPYSAEILGAALELVNDTTSHHLDRIIQASQTTCPDLAECCKHTQILLKAKLDISITEGFNRNTTKSAFLSDELASSADTKSKAKRQAKRLSVQEQSNFADSIRTTFEENNNDVYTTIRPMISNNIRIEQQQKRVCIIL